MIRTLRGSVSLVEEGGLVVEVSGWGVYVAMPTTESYAKGDTVALLTYLAVKQDGMELYGFSSPEDRHFFELSLKVPGVGPKTALSLLRRAPRAQLEEAIGKKDLGYLTRVVGLGKKTAEKFIIEIGEKLGASSTNVQGEDGEVFDTLIALGYTEREARKAVGDIPATIEGKEARLRAALSHKS
ncbi:MAG: Holliday junction branch migration protein RuvA [Minisyncoccia bacterium]